MQDTTHAATNLAHQAGGAVAHAAETSGHSLTHMMMHLIIQLAVIIIVAKIGGYLFQRFLKMPSVLGELASGMLIGPYALGGMIDLPSLGILFAESHGFAASPQLYGIATLASIILLFLAGLETDLAAFLRYSTPSSVRSSGLADWLLPLRWGLVLRWYGRATGSTRSWIQPRSFSV